MVIEDFGYVFTMWGKNNPLSDTRRTSSVASWQSAMEVMWMMK